MIFGLEILDIAAVGPLLASVPESAGVLAFGVGLISFAGIIRWVFKRRDDEKSRDDKGE